MKIILTILTLAFATQISASGTVGKVMKDTETAAKVAGVVEDVAAVMA